MKIYYAHHLYKYDTKVEEYELDLIRKYFPGDIVINPNGYVDQTGTEERIMKVCLEVIGECDALVFSSMSGVVGKGVHDEINKAIDKKMPIYYINRNSIWRVIDINWKMLNESRRIYAAPQMILTA